MAKLNMSAGTFYPYRLAMHCIANGRRTAVALDVMLPTSNEAEALGMLPQRWADRLTDKLQDNLVAHCQRQGELKISVVWLELVPYVEEFSYECE